MEDATTMLSNQTRFTRIRENLPAAREAMAKRYPLVAPHLREPLARAYAEMVASKQISEGK